MAQVSVKIDSHVNAVKEAVKKQVVVGLESVGATAEEHAKANCPVDTGLLRNSITYAVGGKATAISEYSSDDGEKSGSYGSATAPEDKSGEVTLYIGTNVEYAEAVEFRDIAHKTGKAHFLKDAVSNHGSQYKELIETALRALN